MRIIGLALAAFLVLPVASASGQTGGLKIVQPESVTFTITDDTTDTISVWVENGSEESVTPTFELAVEDDDGAPVDGLTVRADGPDEIADSSVARYRLSVAGVDAETDASGRLVASGSGPPGDVPVSIGPKPNLIRGVDAVIVVPFVVAAILCVLGIALAGGTTDVLRKIPTAGFDFKKSFATTLTTVGGVLALVLAADVLPAETKGLSNEAFTALSVLFVAAIAIAAVIPAAGQVEDEAKTWMGLFWLAAVVTAWAAFGQLLMLWLALDEIGAAQGFSDEADGAFRVLLGIGALAMAIHVPVRIKRVIKLSDPSAAKASRDLFFDAAPAAERTPML